MFTQEPRLFPYTSSLAVFPTETQRSSWLGFHRGTGSHPETYWAPREHSMSGFPNVALELWKEGPNILHTEDSFAEW